MSERILFHSLPAGRLDVELGAARQAAAAEVMSQILRETGPRVARHRAGVSFRPTLKLRVVCCYCGLVMIEGDPGAETSHGACAKCTAEELEKVRMRRPR
jgi:hypothetical protein